MISAIIFDMDGTLLDSLYDLYLSTNYALLKFNLKTRTIDEIKNFIGDGVEKLIERAVEKNTSTQITKKCLETFKSHYFKNMYNNSAPFKGIIEVLKKLKENNIKTAVLSNKFDGAIKELTQKYFKDLIDITLGQSNLIPKKPSAVGINYIINKLNVEKRQTIYTGDSDIDILSAKNAKIKSIGVLWGYRNKEFLKDADYIISNPYEILDIVLNKKSSN